MANSDHCVVKLWLSIVLGYFCLLQNAYSLEADVQTGDSEVTVEALRASIEQWQSYSEKLTQHLASVEALNKANSLQNSQLVAELDTLKAEVTNLVRKVETTELLLQGKEQILSAIEEKLGKTTESDDSGLQHRLEAILSKAEHVHALEKELEDLRILIAELEKRVEHYKLLEGRHEQLVVAMGKQEIQLKEAEHALSFAKASMKKAAEESATYSRSLKQMADGWLPPWAVVQLQSMKTTAKKWWIQHGKPVQKKTYQKVSTGLANAQSTLAPHINAGWTEMKKRYISTATALQPTVDVIIRQQKKLRSTATQHWETAYNFVEPHAQQLRARLQKTIEAVQPHIEPHVTSLGRFCSPYVKVVGEKAGPVMEAVRPHVVMASEVIQQNLAWVQRATLEYHQQLQAAVRDLLVSQSIITDPTDNQVWLLASVAMSIPLLVLVVLSWPFLGGWSKNNKPGVKAKKHSRRKHR